MAKDPAMGPISKPEGGHYGDPEEVAEEQPKMDAQLEDMSEEILARSPIINLFGEKAGQLLLDAGYSSVDAVMAADDEILLDIKGIGEVLLKEIRGTVLEQEEAPASVRVQRIREASQS